MAALFSPWGNSQFVDGSGNPAVGYRIFSYLAGSSTPAPTFTDSSGLIPQSNPIILNSLGLVSNGQLWLSTGIAYKFVLHDAFGAEVDTVDNIVGNVNTSNQINQFQPSGVTPTYISDTTFTLLGDQTTAFHVGRRLRLVVTGNTIYSTIVQSVYSGITTVTIANDNAPLNSGLSSVDISLLTATYPAIPKIAVGTVSQAFGVQTGAVIETGSNENGTYIKFADGTQIVRRNLDMPTVALGASSSATALFPVPFIDSSFQISMGCIGSPSGDKSQIGLLFLNGIWETDRSVSGVTYATYGYRSSTIVGVNFGLIIIGRWF